MNAQTPKDNLVMLSNGVTNFNGFDRQEMRGETAPAGLVARIGAWLGAIRRKQAVIEELSMLTDRELADIGLARSDVPHVFDRSFGELRDEQRTGQGRAFGAYQLG